MSKKLKEMLLFQETEKVNDDLSAEECYFEFIKLNKGKIQIVSADGYWEFIRGKTEAKLFDN